jgi:hypothetical protein
MSEQERDSWLEQRVGRFTSSRITELMGIKALGLTGETYAHEKAFEIVEGRGLDDGYVSFDMQRGIDLEPYALEEFAEICSFFALGNYTGGTPDSLVDDDALVQVKCPSPLKLAKLVRCGHDAIDKVYVDQMQHELYVTGRKRNHFFNFAIYNGKPIWHEIVIERNEPYIDLIKRRIDEAVIIRDEFVKQLNQNKQWS